MAAFCWQRSQEITDNLVDFLIQLIHKLGTKAERRVTEELIQDFKRVTGKHQLLYRIASAALANPDGTVRDVIYPIATPDTLNYLVREFQSTGTSYRQKVHKVIRRSYQHHYRRMVPQLLDLLEFRSNNEVHQPVIQGLRLLKKYANSQQRHYDPEDILPWMVSYAVDGEIFSLTWIVREMSKLTVSILRLRYCRFLEKG